MQLQLNRATWVTAMLLLIYLISPFAFSTNAFAQFRTDPEGAPRGRIGLIANSPGTISECDFCLCSQGISPLEMGRTGVRYDVRYLKMSRVYQDGTIADNSSHELETYFTNQFTFLYKVANDLSAIAIVPVTSRHASALTDPTVPASTSVLDNTGMGDISVFGRYNILADHAFADTRIVSVTAGVKLPTGSIQKRDASGDWADPDLQLGTGSTDLLIGGGMLLGFDNWSMGANLLAGITGTGARGHRYGNNFNYTLTGRYKIWPNDYDDPIIFGALSIIGEARAHETQDGAKIDDSGGNVIYLAPGIQCFFSPKLSFDASFQQPIVHALNGEQLGETFRIMSGIQYMF